MQRKKNMPSANFTCHNLIDIKNASENKVQFKRANNRRWEDTGRILVEY